MAHTDTDTFQVKPRAVIAAHEQRELARTHNMLVATAVGSMIIIVVAALFMTMF
jgi:hypothetical protein